MLECHTTMIISLISRQNHHHHLRHHLRRRHLSTLHSKYNFTPPPSLHPQQPPPPPQNPNPNPKSPPKKPQFRPQSSHPSTQTQKPLQSKLPFDFYFSYTESHPSVKPIGLRGPKYSPFGPGRLGREWTGVCAPVKARKVRSVDGDHDVAESNHIGVGPGRLGREWAGDCAPVKRNVDGDDDVAIGLGVGWLGRDLTGDDVADDEEEVKLRERRRVMRESILGAALTEAEKKVLVEGCKRGRCKRQVNLGRDGLTHNMLNDIHNHWKHDEAVRIKCMGVPTMDMDNVCTQLEDKTCGKIIHRQGGLLVLYRGRKYKPKKRPVIPLMLWKPQEPVYPKMVKTTIEGLSIEETKEMRKRGLAVPALTKLSRNGYYGNLVPMVRDAFLVAELVRIDCTGLDKSDHKKIGVKLRDLVPCIPVTFAKEQIVVWRGPNYEPPEDRLFLAERESSDMSIDNMVWDS